jgi:hypothetical protein
VHSLDGLAKLHLVSDQDDVPRAHAHGNEIRQGHLPSFVKKEIVQGLCTLCTREEPGRPSDQRRMGRHAIVVRDILDHVAVKEGIGLIGGTFLLAIEPEIVGLGGLFHGGQEIVDRFMRVGRNADLVSCTEEGNNDVRGHRGLAGAGWSLDTENTLAQIGDDPDGCLKQVSPLGNDRRACWMSDNHRHAATLVQRARNT